MDHYSSSFVSASFGAPPTKPAPFYFVNLNASSSAGARPTVTLQLIDLIDGQGVAASGNQQNGAFSYENTQQQPGRRLSEEYTDKKLARFDVDRRQCRLLLPKHFVVSNIFRSMDRTAADLQCSSTDGFPIDVLDVDINRSFPMRLKQWRPTSYVLTGNWIKDFVDRKGLKEGDTVGLAYHESKLHFKHVENHS